MIKLSRSVRQIVAGKWARLCFGDATMTPLERVRRTLEEALELAQAEGMSREDMHRLVDYVSDRPVGDPIQELGGVCLTLLVYADTKGVSLEDVELEELRRVQSKSVKHFKDRHNAKAAAGVAEVVT